MLIGYFCGKPYGESKEERKYKVTIECDYEGELVLGADSPFVVSYDSDTNVFSPMRISTATVNVVASDYLLQIFSPCAQGTPITLSEILDEDNEILRWKGYLKPNLSNMGYSSCIDYVTLEASDCLASLQYLDFSPAEENLRVVSFDSLLSRATELAGLDHYYWSDNKSDGEGRLTPFELMMSEKNFWTTDTDDPWRWDEVISEMCKYLGCTAIQWGNGLYILDYGQYMTTDSQTLIMNGIFSHPNVISGVQQIDEKSYRGNGNNLSMDNVYNKIIVKDNFMTIDEFIPELFNDSYLKNRAGDFWKATRVTPLSGKRAYVNHAGYGGNEKVSDSKYEYYTREFDNDYYQSLYPFGGSSTTDTSAKVSCSMISSNFDNDSVVVLEVVNNDTVEHRVSIYLDVKWSINNQDHPEQWFAYGANENIPVHPNDRQIIEVHAESSRSTDDDDISMDYELKYRVDGGALIDYFNANTSNRDNTVTSLIIDLAYMERDTDKNAYNYEVPNAISFERYLLLKQCEKPEGYLDPRFSGGIWNPLSPSNYENYFRPVMQLKENYSNPLIISKNAYLAIDANALWERYAVNYINPEWTTKTSWDSSVIGWMNRTDTVGIMAPALFFKLRIGNKYWNGSSWTTTDSSFYVNLSTDTEKDGDVDFKKMYNSEHHVLNNISWTEWTSGKGYKIPLNESFDYNDIDFKILLPLKIQYVETKAKNDGINGCVWVKDFSIKLVTKDEDNYPLADVEYSNVLNDCSINEYPDITLKYTTYPGNGKQAYSNVGVRKNREITLLEKMKDDNVTDTLRTPEENLLERYYNQYNSPTLTENLDVDLSFNPLHKIKDMYWDDDKYFIITGGELDYAEGRQNMQITQIKQV